MEIRYSKSAQKAIESFALELVKKLVLAWDPDYTKATAAEDAAMSTALEELATGEYVTHDAINWN